MCIRDRLKTQEDLFEKFGGHSGACGFSMKRENLPALRAGLERQMKELRERDPQIFRKKYDIDLEVSPDDLTVDLADQLEMLAPFGSKNPKPLMRCKDVMIDGVRYMGCLLYTSSSAQQSHRVSETDRGDEGFTGTKCEMDI